MSLAGTWEVVFGVAKVLVWPASVTLQGFGALAMTVRASVFRFPAWLELRTCMFNTVEISEDPLHYKKLKPP